MSTQDIVAKLWNHCNVLRDDGVTYHQYVTELTNGGDRRLTGEVRDSIFPGCLK